MLNLQLHLEVFKETVQTKSASNLKTRRSGIPGKTHPTPLEAKGEVGGAQGASAGTQHGSKPARWCWSGFSEPANFAPVRQSELQPKAQHQFWCTWAEDYTLRNIGNTSLYMNYLG